ncbi:Nn.00g010000.m01.CDS01 [Neocucurbitaria sp. VM-36]
MPPANTHRQFDQAGLILHQDDQEKEVERFPLREADWVFAEEEAWEVGVGGYVARETEGKGDDSLEAEFGEGVEVVILE